MSMFFVFIVSAQAQKTVNGTVNSGGLPLPGANVAAKGASVETSTDIDGKFTLKVPENVTKLVVSFVGYTTKEVAITDGNMTIELSEESNALEEVVINVGYGTQKKSVVTGAISKVTAKDLENVPNGRVEQALQGRTAGVTIAMNAGQPGAGSTVRVRGITTLNDNNPLWVIDGVAVDPGALGALNQSDIESIEVLKDASSTAIYGARGANGVIIITTKKGKSGAPKYAFSSQFSVSNVTKKADVFSADEIRDIVKLQFASVQQSLLEIGVTIDASEEALDWLAELGYDPQFGARPLKRVIQKRILNELSKQILAGTVNRDSKIKLDVFDHQFVFLNT